MLSDIGKDVSADWHSVVSSEFFLFNDKNCSTVIEILLSLLATLSYFV